MSAPVPFPTRPDEVSAAATVAELIEPTSVTWPSR